jgi:uncharacterized membrane protein
MSQIPLLVRLVDLESRVARLETALRLTTAPAAGTPPAPGHTTAANTVLPPSPPAPWPTAAAQPAATVPPPTPRPAPARRDLERYFGIAVLGRVGIAAMLLAAAYFGQLGWTELSPLGRVLAIYALGVALLGVGAFLRPRVAPHYTALLWGGAVAVTYLAGAYAHLGYGLLAPLPASFALLASAALGQFLAHRLRREVLATVALAGAFAAPVLVQSPAATPTALFALAIVLHGWSAWTERQWGWHRSRIVGVLGAVTLATLWYGTRGAGLDWSDVLHLDTLLLAIAFPELLVAWRNGRIATRRWLAVAALTTTTQLFLLLGTGQSHACRHFAVATGAALLAVAAAYQQRSVRTGANLGTAFARLGSVLLPVGALVLVSHEADPGTAAEQVRWGYAASLLGVAVVLQLLRRAVLAVDLGSTCTATLAASFAVTNLAGTPAQVALFAAPSLVALAGGRHFLTGTLAMLLGAAALGFGWWPIHGFHGAAPGWATLAMVGSGGFAIVGTLVAARRADRALAWSAALLLTGLAITWFVAALASDPTGASGLTPFWNHRALAILALLVATATARLRTPLADSAVRTTLGATALALAYTGGLVETLDATANWPTGWHAVTIDLYTLLFAGTLLAAGFRTRQPALRWTGLTAFALIAAKVALFDLATLDTPFRVLATAALGLVLLLAAFTYSRLPLRIPHPVPNAHDDA